MADEFCFSLLHTTTLQILQAAGFNAGHSKAAHVLTNVFEKYIELLSTTASAYSNLSGRTTGNILDCIDTLEELAIDIPTFKSWLADEARLLSPSWTDQGDPSRILNGIVNSGLNRQEDYIMYEFNEYENISKDAVEEKEEKEVIEEIYEEEKNRENNLPSYVPSYFPSFPVIIPLVEDENESAMIETKTQLPTVASDTLPLPNIVKKKKKPIDNPFTFLKPFEESMISTVDTDQPEALSLSMKLNDQHNNIARINDLKRRRKRSESLSQLIDEIQYHNDDEHNKRKLIQDVNLYNETTKDKAAPGNTMFSQEFGLLKKFMTDVAPPIAIPKLMTPNMMIDIVIPSGAATPTSTIRLNMTPTNSRKPSLGGITIEESSIGSKSSTAATTPTTANDLIPSTEKASNPIKIAPVSLASLSTSSSIEEKKSKPLKEKKEKSLKSKKKLTISLPKPKSDLLLNMANPNQDQPKSSATSPVSTTTTPVIRFTLKPPTEQESTPKSATPSDIINCVCDNPTVDYGAFMVACDTCGIWYHGSCVGIAETDQIDEWHCVWCIESVDQTIE